MPLRKEYPEGLNRDGIPEAPEAAMSSGSSIMSGLVGLVRWWETASAAVSYARNVHHAEFVAQGFLFKVTKPGI